MATGKISSSSSLIETLHALARERGKVGQHPVQAGGTDSQHPTQLVARKDEVQALRQRLHALANAADFADVQSMQQARKQVLTEILLWEFGGDFRNDSQFSPTLDAIDKTLELDTGFQQRFLDMMIGLRKSGARG